jgi:hypothetical protein
MKKAIPIISIALLWINIAIAQTSQTQANKIAPTTEDEYNTGSVGYKMMLTMKVELKPGYSLSDYSSYEYGDRKAEFKGLLRKGETRPCAVLMIYQKLRNAPEYYCIPTPDAPEILWDRYRASLTGETDNKQEQLQFFGYALAKAMMYFAGQ